MTALALRRFLAVSALRTGKARSCIRTALLLGFALTLTAPAQIFTSMMSFGGGNGANPNGPLVQGFDGSFYGTTYAGGAYNSGTIFKITAQGAQSVLYSFCSLPSCSDGAYPVAALIQAANGNLYGTTELGGKGFGTVFRITPAGLLTTLHTFGSNDGALPSAALVQANDGTYYGTTTYGGASNAGTIFRVNAAGTLITLYSFKLEDDAGYPVAPLIQAANGNFYGTTFGDNGYGTIFRITPAGALTTVYNFCAGGIPCADGLTPYGGLAEGTDGNLYGTSENGGTHKNAGTIFKVTPEGLLTTLYRFHNSDGQWPAAQLLFATDGRLYGTTQWGGAYGQGAMFVITTAGRMTTLHNFNTFDGAGSYTGLLQATNGNLYGTTYWGGDANAGTMYRMDMAMSPFVRLSNTAGKPRRAVHILGNELTQASRVTFNGTPAAFTVISDTLIETTVPLGATSGRVQVTTPAGTLTSNTVYRIKP